MAAIFESWVPHTEGFGYSFESNGVTYSGRWQAPYTALTINQALNLVDPKLRYDAERIGSATYDYKQQIEHSLIPWLTAQRASLKPTDGFAPNVMNGGVSIDGQWLGQANATNTIQNAPYCVIDIEWLMKPVNSFGFNAAFVSVNGVADFQEMGNDQTGYVKQLLNTAERPGGTGQEIKVAATASNTSLPSFMPLTKGYTRIEPKDTVTIEYPWVDSSLVNLQAMRELRGKINLNDVLQWYAGTLLYEGSDVESAISPLGNYGYKIVHHFTARAIDWNLIPILPDTTANVSANQSWNDYAYGWATYKPKMDANSTGNVTYPNLTANNTYSSWQNRVYGYNPFFSKPAGVVSSVLFFYGFNPGASWYAPPVNPIA